MDIKRIMNNLAKLPGITETDGLLVKKDIKEGRNWRLECPHIGDDLEFQIHPRDHFGSLIIAKKIAKLVKELETRLADEKFGGEFLIDVVTDARAIIITQKGFWSRFSSSPAEFASVVEEACNKIL